MENDLASVQYPSFPAVLLSIEAPLKPQSEIIKPLPNTN